MLATTLAFQNDRAGFTGLLSYIVIVYSYLCDLLIFKEKINAIEFIATIVILFVALGVAFYKLVEQRKQAKLKEEEEKEKPPEYQL